VIYEGDNSSLGHQTQGYELSKGGKCCVGEGLLGREVRFLMERIIRRVCGDMSTGFGRLC
jgi:hypothetical protein